VIGRLRQHRVKAYPADQPGGREPPANRLDAWRNRMEPIRDPHPGQDPGRVAVEAAKLGANLVLAEAAGRFGSVGRFGSAGVFGSVVASLGMPSHDTLTREA
jgi:hypothetical protein